MTGTILVNYVFIFKADMLNIRIESGRRIQEFRERPDRRTLYSESTSTTLPKIGSRVRRGPDWPMTDDHDDNGPGTVVGHSEEGKHRLQ